MDAPFIDNPRGWFVVDVMPKCDHSLDWVALLIDIPYEDLRSAKHSRKHVRECWYQIPGKHPDRDAAWDALDALMATRH